jgi:ferritin-like metal-binding protein YciE
MRVDSLKTLFERQLQDVYDAEKQLVRALPKIARKASSTELRNAVTEHLEATKGHVRRLEEIFEDLGVKAKSRPCAGMKGLIEEGKESMEEDAKSGFMDLSLIAAAQRVEHYEISAYGTMRTLAEQLNESRAADLLQQTLDEESEADQKLTQISESILERISTEEPKAAEAAGRARSKTTQKPRVRRSSGAS